jgi:hypothetical protein
MTSTKAIARRAGIVYLIFMVVAIYGEFLFPSVLVPGDPAATARNIAAAELTYRLGIVLGLVTHLVFVVLVVTLYQLFRDVDRSQALLMVLLVAIGVTVALDLLLNRFAPLVLLGGDQYLSVFSQAEREALALGALRYRGSGTAIPMTFWGLWLFPFGILVIKSRFIPRVLGILLLIAGVAYLVTGLTAFLWPDARAQVARFVTPLYFGEVPIIFWLLIKGARELAPAERGAAP